MAKVKDVVCGMTVNSEAAEYRSEHKGQTYYFCSVGCKRSFDQDPEKHVNAQPSSPGGARS